MSQKKNDIPPLKYALIGCGRVSVKHIKAVLKKVENLSFVAIVDKDPDAPASLLKSAGYSTSKTNQILSKIHFYNDYKEMLQQEKPDVTAITTPSGLHYEMAREAMNQGSHILLEKPMSMSSLEAKKLYQLSQETGKKIAMGHIYRYFPIVGFIRDDIRNHIFGKISHGSVYVRWGHDQSYYDQAKWRGTWKLDGGVLMNQTVHALDLVCWLLDSPATNATGMIAKQHHSMEAEDLGYGIIELENNILCQIEGTTNTLSSRHEAGFFISGSKGSAALGIKNGLPYFDIRNESGKKINMQYYRRELKKTGIRKLMDFFNPHIGIYKDLVDAILENRDPIAPALAGYTSVDNILGLYKSALTGTKISLPLTDHFTTEDMSEFFPGDCRS